jgi:hypothetical protein
MCIIVAEKNRVKEFSIRHRIWDVSGYGLHRATGYSVDLRPFY